MSRSQPQPETPDEQARIKLGTGRECDLDLGYRVECFRSPRIQYPQNDPFGIMPDTAFVFPASFSQPRTKTPRWYTIKASAFSIERSIPGAGPVPGTSNSDVINGDPGGGLLKLEVTDGENQKFVADIGQGRDFSVLSRGITARVEAPPGSVLVEDGRPGLVVPGAPLPFFIGDAIVNVAIVDGIAPIGGANATLTRLYRIRIAGVQDVFPIPARAQRVQFSVFAPFGVTTPIARFATNFSSATPGRVGMSSVQLQATESTTAFIDVPGDATAVQFPLAAPGNVLATWELSW